MASRPSASRLQSLAALGIIAASALVAVLWFSRVEGSNSQGSAVRQVFTERSESEMGVVEVVADTWVLLDQQGNPQAFIGLYYAQGELWQLQYRTSSQELSVEGTGRCVIETGPAPGGMTGLLPASRSEAELLAQGYAPASKTDLGPQPDPIPAVSAEPKESQLVDLNSATYWSMTISGAEGASRERVIAVDDSGLLIGFASVTRDGTGRKVAVNSQVIGRIESYDASMFSEIERGLPLHGLPSCN